MVCHSTGFERVIRFLPSFPVPHSHSCLVSVVYFLGGLILLTVLLVALHPLDCGATDHVWLITPEEAAMSPAPDSTGEGKGRGFLSDDYEDVDEGPGINVVKPSVPDKVKSPLEIVVHFIERNAPVALSSLNVSILKRFLSFNITDRVKPYVTSLGIDMKEAHIPAGRYIVRISVGDAQGRMSSRHISIEVF